MIRYFSLKSNLTCFNYHYVLPCINNSPPASCIKRPSKRLTGLPLVSQVMVGRGCPEALHVNVALVPMSAPVLRGGPIILASAMKQGITNQIKSLNNHVAICFLLYG